MEKKEGIETCGPDWAHSQNIQQLVQSIHGKISIYAEICRWYNIKWRRSAENPKNNGWDNGGGI